MLSPYMWSWKWINIYKNISRQSWTIRLKIIKDKLNELIRVSVSALIYLSSGDVCFDQIRRNNVCVSIGFFFFIVSWNLIWGEISNEIHKFNITLFICFDRHVANLFILLLSVLRPWRLYTLCFVEVNYDRLCVK